MFLYSLLAEGGIPEALLHSPGLYRKVVMGLLMEIENEGGSNAAPWAERIASRWITRLPQTFQNPDCTRLLAELALSLVELRSELPADLPETAAERWLTTHNPNWLSRIPIRMTHDVAESLIRPALQTERNLPFALGPLCRRELCRNTTGNWYSYLTISEAGSLPVRHFPRAEGLRLRLLLAGATSIEGLSYSATPEEKGWRLRRFGGGGDFSVSFPMTKPFALAAFADGQAKGEAVIEPGLVSPTEAPGFWRAANPDDGARATRLIPIPGAIRTQAPCLWLLSSDDDEPMTGEGLTLDDIENAPEGFLWRISGKGVLRLGEKSYRVETKAEEEAPDATLAVFGSVLHGWRMDGDMPVYRGELTVFGQKGASSLHPIPEQDIRRTPSRTLGGEIVEWMEKGEALARRQLVRLPESVNFDLQEIPPGHLEFRANGLEPNWRVRLTAGEVETWGSVENGSAQLNLETTGIVPGVVSLRLSEPETGAVLNLQTVWPDRNGMILDPDGLRLAEHRPISVEALYGWRVIAPDGAMCSLRLRLDGRDTLYVPVHGEVSLSTWLPFIQAILAQGGSDAQVDLSLEVSGGQESKRLQVRRYHHKSVVENGVLRTGLERDKPIEPETDFATQFNRNRPLTLHVTDMNRPEKTRWIETTATVDLHKHLGDTGGPWLIQPRLEGQLQRAAVWEPNSQLQNSREDRIKVYTEGWQRLISVPEATEWEHNWRLIMAAAEGGHPGVLDQVQALAREPAAAVALALRIPREKLLAVMELDSSAPFLWPVFPVSDFSNAIKAEHRRRMEKLAPIVGEDEAEPEADKALIKQVREILTLRPELAGHFGKAFTDIGMLVRIINYPDHQETLKQILISDPVNRLTSLAQEAAKRFVRLPVDAKSFEAHHRPDGMSFNHYAQPVIDAPLAAAEMAAGQRSAPSVAEKLALINLRLVDPIYFDAALPSALHFVLKELQV